MARVNICALGSRQNENSQSTSEHRASSPLRAGLQSAGFLPLNQADGCLWMRRHGPCYHGDAAWPSCSTHYTHFQRSWSTDCTGFCHPLGLQYISLTTGGVRSAFLCQKLPFFFWGKFLSFTVGILFYLLQASVYRAVLNTFRGTAYIYTYLHRPTCTVYVYSVHPCVTNTGWSKRLMITDNCIIRRIALYTA